MENTPVIDTETEARKREFRNLMKATLEKVDWNTISIQVLQNLKSYFQNSVRNQQIAGFWPLLNEIKILSFLEELCSNETSVCLPVIEKKDHSLKFYKWTPATKMDVGFYQIPIPKDKTHPIVPDIILVPLIAFDKDCHRLGRGGGYYDRTLQELRAVKRLQTIGLAAEKQLVQKLPRSLHDQPLDLIITEQRVYRLNPLPKS